MHSEACRGYHRGADKHAHDDLVTLTCVPIALYLGPPIFGLAHVGPVGQIASLRCHLGQRCMVVCRPIAVYTAGMAMAVPHLWVVEYAKVGVVVITNTQYGRTTSKLHACYSPGICMPMRTPPFVVACHICDSTREKGHPAVAK